MNKVSTYYVGMNAYRAVVFVEDIHTDELCQYVGDGSDASGNVKLLGKKTRKSLWNIASKENTTHESGPSPLTPTTS